MIKDLHDREVKVGRTLYRGDIVTYNTTNAKGSVYNNCRPYMILTRGSGSPTDTRTVVPLTCSHKKDKQGTHMALTTEEVEFLKFDSQIMLEHIYTLPAHLKQQYIGRLDENKIDEICLRLRISLGIDDGIEDLGQPYNRGDEVLLNGNIFYIVQNNTGNLHSPTTILCSLKGKLDTQDKKFICKTGNKCTVEQMEDMERIIISRYIGGDRMQAKIEELKKFRMKKNPIQPFKVFTNDMMHELLAKKPSTLEALGNLKGWGKKRIEEYGEEVLEIVKPKAGRSSNF